MNIHLPRGLRRNQGDIKFFFDLMIRKLNANRHKGFNQGTTIEGLMGLIQVEVIELREELQKSHSSQFSAAMEAVDISNYGLLLGMLILSKTRNSYDADRKEIL
jgi:hypothetical protein